MDDFEVRGGGLGESLGPARKKRRKRYVKPGNLHQLRATLWQALTEVETICSDDFTQPELKIKAAHALATLSGSYLKILEIAEHEERLKTLEEKYAELAKASSKPGNQSGSTQALN